MDNLCIKLPEEFHAPQEFGLDSNPESIQKWLAELPLANTQQSAEEVLALVKELNRSELPPLLRYQHLKVVLPVADCLGEILRSHYSGALLPLSSKNLKKHSVVSNLSNALATGFRLIEKQLREHNHIKWREKGLLVTCLYLAIQQLSNILLDYYLVYFPEPQKIWGEINRLYAYAEKHQLLDTVVPQGENSSLELTVSHIYKSVLMLATASPYHMMQQEALNLRKYFYQVATHIKLQKHDDNTPMLNFVIDINQDSHPHYVTDKNIKNMSNPRYIDIHSIVDHFKTLYIEAATNEKSQNDVAQQQNDLENRLLQDTINRLIKTVGRDQERQHERNSILGEINLSIGLAASHYHVSNESPFNPELDEVRIYTGKQPGTLSSLALNPVNFDNTSDERKKTNSRQQAIFCDKANALDIWDQTFTTNSDKQTSASRQNRSNDVKKIMATSSWTQKNTSDGGLCIFCRSDSSLPVRVGEIVSYNKSEDDPWHIGVIRWLRVHENLILEIGIMHLMSGAKSVACRKLSDGNSSQYTRCLLANEDIGDPDNSIIVPSSLFASESEMVINLGNKIHYIKLRRQLLISKSATQFKFTISTQPASEIECMNKLIKNINR